MRYKSQIRHFFLDSTSFCNGDLIDCPPVKVKTMWCRQTMRSRIGHWRRGPSTAIPWSWTNNVLITHQAHQSPSKLYWRCRLTTLVMDTQMNKQCVGHQVYQSPSNTSTPYTPWWCPTLVMDPRMDNKQCAPEDRRLSISAQWRAHVTSWI